LTSRLLGLSRRKATATVIDPRNDVPREMPVKKLRTACSLNCPDICAFVVHVEHGRVIRLEGDKNHPYTLGRCCPKGYAHVLRTYSEDRLLHPQRRQADGTFKTITWDDALDEIAAHIDEARHGFGPQSVGIYSGSGNDGLAPKYAARFSNVIGCRMIPGIAEICFEGAYEGARFNVGPFPPHELSDWVNSKCIVIWGTNKFESSLHSKRIIREAIDRGAKLIVIDPRKTPHAKMADIYTTIRPGTDAALALGIANEIVKRDLYHHEFVKRYVVGFEEYKRRVAQYDKKAVSLITWVDQNTIEAIALTFATHGPALIMTAPAGMNHYTNGTWAARAVHSLLAICGYLGVSGAGFQYLSSDCGPFNGSAITLADMLPESVTPVVPSGTLIPEYVLSPGESPLKVLIIQAASPMTQWPNTRKTRAALERIPFKVCVDIEMTDTARMCEVVLPATTLFEHHNLVHSELHRIVQYAPKIVRPRGEAKHELEIWTGIAMRLGLGQYFRLTEIDAIKLALRSHDCEGITLERLKENPGGIRTKSPAIPFADHHFLTQSGKVELYSKMLEDMGFDPLPFHEEPAESPVSTPVIFKDHPLIMISGRLRTRLHSQYTTVDVGAEAKSYSECTTCQKCIKECEDEAISLQPPSLEALQGTTSNDSVIHARMRSKLSELVRRLAVKRSGGVIDVPSGVTGLLIPKWNSEKCIGCRECNLDFCPFDVVTEPIRMPPMNETQIHRTFLSMNPNTADRLELADGDLVRVESVRGSIDRVRLEISEDIDHRVVWISDGWWDRDGNINLLTDDRHTAFGHTPGFNSVLVRVSKQKQEHDGRASRA